MKSFLRLLAVLVLTAPVFAACPLVTDSFYTVAPGKYELDAGYGTTNSETVLTNAVGLVLRRGITPQLDLAVALPYTISDPAGLNDIYLHAKYKIWQNGAHEGLTGRVDYKFQNASQYQGLGTGDSDCLGMLIYSRMFGSAQAHFNLGYVNTGINAGRIEDDYFAYSAALEHPLWDKKGTGFVEYVGNNALNPSPAFILLGLRYEFFAGSKIDTGYAFGLNDKSIKNNLTAELHCEF